MTLRTCLRSFAPLCLLPLAASLAGCTLQTTAALSSPDIVAGPAIDGVAHGGQQAITGAKVYLLAVNPTGYGGPGIAASAANASISLLNPALTQNPADSIGSYVLTNSSTGGFSLSGDYACASGFAQSTGTPVTLSGTEQVYLYILGGSGAQTLGLNNPASGLLVALGPCNAPTAHVTANEVATVATAYAFAGFATDATHIGSSGSALALTNLSNAFATLGNLVNTATGVPASSTAGGNGTVPSAAIYTIADIIAACVNSSGSNTGSCGTIFPYMKSGGATGTLPTDTATATINLAHNPWPTANGMTALYGVIPSLGAPFVGASSNQPNDFTLVLRFPDSTLSGFVGYCAIDGSGNLWVPNVISTGGGAVVGSNGGAAAESGEAVAAVRPRPFDFGNTPYLVKFSNTGTLLSGSTGYSGNGFTSQNLYQVAIDTNGNVWVDDGNTVTEFSNSGTINANSPFGGSAGIGEAKSLAIDGSNHVWVGDDYTNKLFELSSTGSLIASGTTANTNSPADIAFDLSGNAWVSMYQTATITKFTSSGGTLTGTDYTGGGLTNPIGVALDNSSHIWVGNVGAADLSEFSTSGSPVSSTGYTGGGLSSSKNTAVDGAGNVWVANNGNSSVSAFSSSGTALSPSAGYGNSSLNSPQWLALDGSGNVWTVSTGYVNELVGAAAPVVTPIAANLAAPYGAKLVNLP